MNTYVNWIARRQVHLGGFIASATPSLETSEDEDDDGDANATDVEDVDASSSSDDEMTVWVTYPLSFVTKKGE